MDDDIERKIQMFMGRSDLSTKISEMVTKNQTRLTINLDQLREFSEDLYKQIIKNPLKLTPIFERILKTYAEDSDRPSKAQRSERTGLKKDERVYKVKFEGMFGKNMVSPRGLTAQLTNQLVCVQGIVTRMSIVKPKLVNSVHYCETTQSGVVKDYYDPSTGESSSGPVNSNIIPVKDNHGNSLSFEYGLSKFKDHQVLLIQEPPERTPVGQLPRSVEVILEEDLVDKVKPGDRVQVSGIFKCISTSAGHGTFKTTLLANSISSIENEIEKPKLTGEDLGNIQSLAKRKDCFDVLANSLAPTIHGHEKVKKALILQLLGGAEKNLENGTHLRGDINLLLIGDPSTAKSQFLRHILSIAPNAINTTGRGSTGVGLTAAVVVDKDTGERHLEAGAMVLGDKGIVCIDEFDKMNDVDRVAIHEVMEQQTVTIAKAGIHCSLNARCSVLAAANPAYGEYRKEVAVAKNINLPESLLSRFDLVFIILDEENEQIDRLIADRVVRNHMCPAQSNALENMTEENIIEPDLMMDDNENQNQVFEKYNQILHGDSKKEILTKDFLRKFLMYAKNPTGKSSPILSDEAVNYITQEWTKLRASEDTKNNNFRAVSITIRTLETIIRLSTAHAKLRLAKSVTKADCEVAMELLNFALFHEEQSPEDKVLMEDIEENFYNQENDDKFKTKRKKKNEVDKNSKKTKQNQMIEEVEKSSSEDEDNDKSNKRPLKKLRKVENDTKPLFKSEDKFESAVSKEQKTFIYNTICQNQKDSIISFEELWNVVKSSPKKDLVKDTNDLLLILLSLDKDGSVMYSDESKEVVIID